MDQLRKDFFISYNKEDKQWAKWIASVLEDHDYTTYMKAWDAQSGKNFILEMNKVLMYSKRIITLLSEDYVNSLISQNEWGSALKNDPAGENRSFIPVRVAAIEPTGLLSAFSYIDLFEKDEETAEKALISGVDIKPIPRKRPAFPGK